MSAIPFCSAINESPANTAYSSSGRSLTAPVVQPELGYLVQFGYIEALNLQLLHQPQIANLRYLRGTRHNPDIVALVTADDSLCLIFIEVCDQKL